MSIATKRSNESLPKISTKRSKKSMSTKRSEIYLTDLPSDVLVEILSRLPLRTLFIVRSVCKKFSLLTTHNPHFISLHSSNAAEILVFQLGVFLGLRIPSYILRLADEELDYELKPLFQLPKMVPPPRPYTGKVSSFILVNSCNELLLFLQSGLTDYCSSIVCNPVTNEYILIPEVDPEIRSTSLTKSMWLGFSPASDQYKVLRLFRWKNNRHDEVSAQVSVVGSNSWSYIDGTPLRRSEFNLNSPMALVNGVMYWHYPSWSEPDLFYFDFKMEKFGRVALPVKFQRKHYTTIGVLGDCLFLTCNDPNGHRVDLWMMTKCGTWRREFVVDTGRLFYCRWKPLQFLQNGEILMLLVGYGLICYDPRSKNIRCFELNKRLKVDYRAVTLTPSFVPLKDTLKVEEVLTGLRPRGDEKEEL